MSVEIRIQGLDVDCEFCGETNYVDDGDWIEPTFLEPIAMAYVDCGECKERFEVHLML